MMKSQTLVNSHAMTQTTGVKRMMYMNGKKFIYVFSEDARDELIGLGYILLKSDDKNTTYIFENNKKIKFNKAKVPSVDSDTLTF